MSDNNLKVIKPEPEIVDSCTVEITNDITKEKVIIKVQVDKKCNAYIRAPKIENFSSLETDKIHFIVTNWILNR